MIHDLHALLRRFLCCERASVAVEAVLVLPVLLWTWVATFVYYEGFRTQSRMYKGTYAVSDVLTRQLDTIGPTFIEGLDDLFDRIAMASSDPWLRVSSLSWDRDAADYRIDWTWGTDGHQGLDATALGVIRDRIPTIGTGETLIVVEAFVPFRPVFNVGLSEQLFYNIVPSRPRRAGQVPFDPNL